MLDSDDEGEGGEPATKGGVARAPDVPHTTDMDDLTKDVSLETPMLCLYWCLVVSDSNLSEKVYILPLYPLGVIMYDYNLLGQ